jgi:hypothetical protein
VLEGIANPPQINVLGSINAGTQAASNMYDLRAKQAQQQLGDILQQATGPDGVVDHQRAQALAAQAGPGVQMGMESFLKNRSALRGEQIVQGAALHSLSGNLSVSAMNDPSDANFAKILASGEAAGLPPSALAEIRRIAALPIEQRGAEAYKHAVGNIDALGQLARGGYPTPKLEQFGNVASPVVTTPPTPWTPGGVRVGRDATTIGPAPGTTKTQSMPYDAQGEIPMDANGVPTRTPLGWRPVERPITAVPGVPTGGQPVGGPGSGAPPALPGTGAPVPAPNSPLRNPNAAPGTLPGRNAPTGPAVPAPVTPTPPVVPAPAVPAPAPAVVPPAPAPFFTGPPQQQPERLKADTDAYTADKARVPDLQNRIRNTAHAYEALKLMQSPTGAGSGWIDEMRSRLGSVGIASAATMNETKLKDEFRKYTERLILDAAGGANTDAGRQMTSQANPGTELSTNANFEVLRNDMGTALQNFAAYKSHDPKLQGAGYLENRAKIAETTDPRGFVWSMYDDDEKKKILEEVARDKTGAADEKLHRAMGMAQRLQLVPPVAPRPARPAVPPPVPPTRQGATLMPPMMPGAPPNPLLA